MPRYTTAYSSFVSRLGEVEALRKLAMEKERDDAVKNGSQISALCRGAIVLLCSHVEAYVKEAGELALESLFAKGVTRENLSAKVFYHISKKNIDELRETTDQERIAEKIFLFLRDDQPFWSKAGPFPQPIPTDRFNQGFSNPAYKKIKAYFNRFGYDEYSVDLGKNLTADYLPVTNMIDHLVDTRNKIAHGDPAATKTPLEVQSMMSMTQKFCVTTDSVFAGWWKKKFCSIR